MTQRMHITSQWKEILLPLFPDKIKTILSQLPDTISDSLEEIRIRAERPLMVIKGGQDYFIDHRGRVSFLPDEGYKISVEDCYRLLESISDYSLYAIEDELKNGYITLRGGYRVGIVGKGVLEEGKLKLIKYCSGFNIRITREIYNVADKVLPYIHDGKKSVFHTLVISSPQLGKTTLLRDIARQLSNGWGPIPGLKVGIVDERSEIAGCYKGVPQNDVGIRTDVLDACPKAEGILMLIRSMSPQVIVTDEMGRQEDVVAVEEALNAGIRMITSVHGNHLDDLAKRPVLGQMISKHLFDRYIVLGNSLGVGTLESVIDGVTFQALIDKPIR